MLTLHIKKINLKYFKIHLRLWDQQNVSREGGKCYGNAWFPPHVFYVAWKSHQNLLPALSNYIICPSASPCKKGDFIAITVF